MKVYIILSREKGCPGSWIENVFLKEEDAKKYLKEYIMPENDYEYDYEIEEHTVVNFID